MSLGDVAKQTKISESLLKALEGGQVERLPGRIFVLNYVRAYATVIGLNPEETVLRYEEIDKTTQTSPPPAALERTRKNKALVQLAIVIVLLAVGAAAFMWWNAMPSQHPR